MVQIGVGYGEMNDMAKSPIMPAQVGSTEDLFVTHSINITEQLLSYKQITKPSKAVIIVVKRLPRSDLHFKKPVLANWCRERLETE